MRQRLHSRHFRRLTFVSLTAFVLVACGGGRSIEGRWNVLAIDGKLIEDSPQAEEPLWLSFEGGELSGWEGCNRIGGGSYDYGGEVLTIASEGTFVTTSGCDRRSEEFLDIILSGPLDVTLNETGTKMTLEARIGSVVLSKDGS